MESNEQKKYVPGQENEKDKFFGINQQDNFNEIVKQKEFEQVQNKERNIERLKQQKEQVNNSISKNKEENKTASKTSKVKSKAKKIKKILAIFALLSSPIFLWILILVILYFLLIGMVCHTDLGVIGNFLNKDNPICL